MSTPTEGSGDELIEVTAHPAGVSAVTQRGAVLGIEFLFNDSEAPAESEDAEG